MASIAVTIPDPQINRVLNAFATAYNYQTTVPDPNNPNGPFISNPENKTQFAKRMIQTYILNVVASEEAELAANTARDSAVSNVNSQIVLS